jgi:cholesterol transport system auxiliary component
MTLPRLRTLLPAAALPLAGCISFGAEPPPSLLSITAAAEVPVGRAETTARAKGITILAPAVPAAIATARVPVQASPTTIAYVKDAQWVEPPARLFARLLADTVTARTDLVVISAQQSISDPGARLTGELRQFGIDAATSSAVVTYDAALVGEGDTAVRKQRFEARVPIAAIDAANAGQGLNQAANQVAAEVAAWIAR